MIRTYLKAEDGNYTREHKDHKEAWAYVQEQMGDNPEPYHGGWIDDWGRQIIILDELDKLLPAYQEPDPEADGESKEALIKRYDNAVQLLGKLRAEAANETSQFGDSGPGSAIQIREQEEYVADLSSKLAKLSVGE